MGRTLIDVEQETFCAWLCEHETAIVGQAGMCFHSPLARWLSEVTGHIYGIDDDTYGRAFLDCCCWHPLPRWASAFTNRLEHAAFRPVTGYEALLILAEVEIALPSNNVRPRAA